MFLGCEIGGTKLQVGVCDRQGKLRHLIREPVLRRAGAKGILAQFQRLLPPLLAQDGVQAIGVGFGGPVDLQHGRAIISHQIDGWNGFPLKRWFERQFHRPVFIDNDQSCAALAEATVGAGRRLRSVFYVTVGTGIGGGLVIDGRIHNGHNGAGEIGQMKVFHKGRWRTIESLASGLAIEQGNSTVTQSARFLGWAIANTIALINPDIVIVGGGVTSAGKKFFGPLRHTVDRLVFPVFRDHVRILAPRLGKSVVVVGAALLAAREGR